MKYLTLFLLVLLAAAAKAKPQSDLIISDFWIRFPNSATTVSAGYFKITNQTTESVLLLRVDCPTLAKTTELHMTVEKNGMMRMMMLENAEIKSKSELVFAQGARHLMLFDIKQPFPKKGQQVECTFHFNNNRQVKQLAKIS